MKNELLSVENINYTQQGRNIIQNLNFHAQIGDFLVLTGANGTGKTTALNILAGLIRPSSGHIVFQGRPIHGGNDVGNDLLSIKKQIGFLSDKPPLYQELTVIEYLHFVAKLRQIPIEKQIERIHETLEDLNLLPYCQKIIATLSKGQQQRVGIAQAILHKPILLLLDEPTHGLDRNQIDSFVHWLHSYQKKATILFSTHHFNEVEAICTKRLLFTEQGIQFLDSLKIKKSKPLEIKHHEYDLHDCLA